MLTTGCCHICKKGSSTLFFSVQDATDLPYADNSFDAIVISNALHIMPYPEKALSEIRRVLKDDGILFAPTFIHGEGTAFKIRAWLLERVGFHVYSKWNEIEFKNYIAGSGFAIKESKVLGSDIAPLCFVAAYKA